MTEPVSNSEISTWYRCRRRWYLTYVLWLASREEPVTGSRQLGLHVHQALEAAAKHGGSPAEWAAQIYGAEMLAHLDQADDIRKEQDLAVVMLEGYEQWAGETGLDEGIWVAAAEADVTADMPGMPGIKIRGRVDQVIRRRSDGVALFRDWKTVGSLSQADALIRSPQMRFYAMLQRLAATDHDPRVDGGQVVYLLRTKRTSRATPPFYLLEEVRYNRNDLNAAWVRAKVAITEMLQAREKAAAGQWQDVAVPTPMDSCSWECPFLQMCPMLDDGSRWQDMARDVYAQEDPYLYYERKPGVVPETTQE